MSDHPHAPPPAYPKDIEDPFYMGSVDAHHRGIIGGAISLDVLLAADGSSMELGQYCLRRPDLERLCSIFLVVHALIGRPAPSEINP